MQEVTVKPRSVFHHYVEIKDKKRELCWSFGTKKKNISFGLYRLTSAVVPSVLKAHVPASNKSQKVQSKTSSKAQQPPYSPTQSLTGKGLPEYGSGSHLNVLTAEGRNSISLGKNSRTSSASSIHSIPIEPINSEQIIPIAHYESGKNTIKGSYYVTHPGTYILVFDNSFSVKTAKKLFFFVGLRDIEQKDNIHRKDYEGWLLKKGNRSMQGFSRRWIEIHSSGVLSYFKAPGRTSHGSLNLYGSAIRLNHDYFNIDIDTENVTYHFKAESQEQFEKWTAVFERYSSGTGLFDGNSFHSEPSVSRGVSRSERDLVSKLCAELTACKKIIDSTKTGGDPKNARKDPKTGLSSFAEVEKLLNIAVEKANELLNMRNVGFDNNMSAAFKACLEDNNRLRSKFGLNQVSAVTFTGNGSMTSQPSFRDEEEKFFDAQDGSFFSTSEDSYDGEQDHSDSDSVDSILDSAPLGLVTSPKLTDSGMSRRKELPAPAQSMENISIMGILRNNVGKDLSTGKYYLHSRHAYCFERAYQFITKNV